MTIISFPILIFCLPVKIRKHKTIERVAMRSTDYNKKTLLLVGTFFLVFSTLSTFFIICFPFHYHNLLFSLTRDRLVNSLRLCAPIKSMFDQSTGHNRKGHRIKICMQVNVNEFYTKMWCVSTTMNLEKIQKTKKKQMKTHMLTCRKQRSAQIDNIPMPTANTHILTVIRTQRSTHFLLKCKQHFTRSETMNFQWSYNVFEWYIEVLIATTFFLFSSATFFFILFFFLLFWCNEKVFSLLLVLHHKC